MSEKYKEYCMKFSNEEIRAYMVDYLISNSMDNKLIKYLSEDGDEIQFNTSEKIGTIVFDGDDENLFINFYGIHTSIFVDDTCRLPRLLTQQGLTTIERVNNAG